MSLTNIEVFWSGPDESVWDLLGGGQGLTLAEGVNGLHLPSFSHQRAKAARVPGSRWLGTTYDERDVILKLHVGDHISGRLATKWRQLDQLVWRAFSEEDLGTLYVITGSGGYRELRCRLGDAPDPAYEHEPSKDGWATYVITLVSDDPFWAGVDVVTEAFSSIPGVVIPYYGGLGGNGFGPPYVTAYSATASAVADNPGDRDAWPRWEVTGPGVWTIGTPGHLTVLPRLDGPADKICVDTDPMVLTVTDGEGNNMWPSLGAHDFSDPIKPGLGQPLTATLSGATVLGATATMTLTPRFRRAW